MNAQLALLWALLVEGLLVIWQLMRLRARMDAPNKTLQAAVKPDDAVAERRMSVSST